MCVKSLHSGDLEEGVVQQRDGHVNRPFQKYMMRLDIECG